MSMWSIFAVGVLVGAAAAVAVCAVLVIIRTAQYLRAVDDEVPDWVNGDPLEAELRDLLDEDQR